MAPAFSISLVTEKQSPSCAPQNEATSCSSAISDNEAKETINGPPLHSFALHTYLCACCTRRVVRNAELHGRPDTNTNAAELARFFTGGALIAGGRGRQPPAPSNDARDYRG